MDASRDGGVDKAEFLAYMLVEGGHVDQMHMEKMIAMFDTLDTDGSGTLTAQDMRSRPASLSGGGLKEAAPAVVDEERGSWLSRLKKPLLASAS